ncbi:MAG: LacI family DNA-binding transcriptional regulator [Kiritimatiellia bacterium]
MEPSATIGDVARHAGVSTATVSRLINGIGPVSDYTERRVRAAIKELHYTPKRKRRARNGGDAGQNPGSQRPIAFVRTGSIASQDRSLVTEHLAEALHRGANSLGRTLTVHHIQDWTSTKIRDVIGDAEGVLLRTSSIREITPKAVSWLEGIPAVQVLGENRSMRLWVDHVTPDNAQAGALAADYLLKKEFEKLVFAAPSLICGVRLERCVSFVRAACDAGKEVQVLFQSSQGVPRVFEQELAGYPLDFQVMESRIDLIQKISEISPRPFGLFIPTDLELATLMPQLQMAGLDFTRDVAAIGCDHETRCLNGLDPMPATMDLHLENIASQAIRRLIFRMDHPAEPLVRIAVAPSLVKPNQIRSLESDLEFS